MDHPKAETRRFTADELRAQSLFFFAETGAMLRQAAEDADSLAIALGALADIGGCGGMTRATMQRKATHIYKELLARQTGE